MNNSTNQDFFHKYQEKQDLEAYGLLHGSIKIVKNYLDKLPEHCEKVSNSTIKKVVNFAKSYKVLYSKNTGPVEVNLN